MSKETLKTLNNKTLIGFTDKRGFAWHYRQELQGDVSNHYPGAIPIEDVRSRLLHWSAIESPVYYGEPIYDADGSITDWVPCKDPTKKAILRDDNNLRLGLFGAGYTPHQPEEWLLKNVENILDDDLAISAAIELREGRRICVEVSLPENVVHSSGFEYRPNLYAGTSFDGTLMTTYGLNITAIVCDNTWDIAMAEGGPKLKYKHTAHSNLLVADAHHALGLISTADSDFNDELESWLSQPVGEPQWGRFLDLAVPIPDEGSKRGVTLAEKKRETLDHLFHYDTRCAPWNDSEWGILQTMNTWFHHERGIKKGSGSRAQRNADDAITGELAKFDNEVRELVVASRV